MWAFMAKDTESKSSFIVHRAFLLQALYLHKQNKICRRLKRQ